jgi:hypothetical protein
MGDYERLRWRKCMRQQVRSSVALLCSALLTLYVYGGSTVLRFGWPWPSFILCNDGKQKTDQQQWFNWRFGSDCRAIVTINMQRSSTSFPSSPKSGGEDAIQVRLFRGSPRSNQGPRYSENARAGSDGQSEDCQVLEDGRVWEEYRKSGRVGAGWAPVHECSGE